MSGGELSGTVTNASRAAVPNVQIILRSTTTEVTSVIMTNSAGFYTLANLSPGSYEMTFAAPAFTTQMRQSNNRPRHAVRAGDAAA